MTTKFARTVRPFGTTHLLVILSAGLPLACLLGLLFGAVPIAPTDLLTALLGDSETQAATIVLDIRLPRVLLAAVTGANLALCGTAMQGLFRNPLADPSLIGVTAGASLGAAIAIVA